MGARVEDPAAILGGFFLLHYWQFSAIRTWPLLHKTQNMQ
jgi:hypothetical protein